METWCFPPVSVSIPPRRWSARHAIADPSLDVSPDVDAQLPRVRPSLGALTNAPGHPLLARLLVLARLLAHWASQDPDSTNDAV